jgi:methionine synthase II (cobalamin-independent)
VSFGLADEGAGEAVTSLHTGAEWAQAYGGKLFPTSVVGSLPRPEYVRELMLATQASADSSGLSVGDEEVLRAAIKAGVAMQLQAGCDVVTDGELGRLSYIGTPNNHH